ncbi:hypothetical protein DL96DRAFT_422840 [Flagelloscypha sp. PMI_526]|nr:hypothetical protein DL96DRAFT_422840 [Flagelloscypha sp. PMI_526]
MLAQFSQLSLTDSCPSSLPPELHGYIIGFFFDDIHTLEECSFVSRSFRAYAQPLLWRNVRLHVPGRGWKHQQYPPPFLVSFKNQLIRSPYIAMYIESLFIGVSCFWHNELADILRKCSNLQKVVLSGEGTLRWYGINTNVFKALNSFVAPRLTSLTIDGIKNFDLAFLRHCTSLRELSLKEVLNIFPTVPCPKITYSQLEKLLFEDVTDEIQSQVAEHIALPSLRSLSYKNRFGVVSIRTNQVKNDFGAIFSSLRTLQVHACTTWSVSVSFPRDFVALQAAFNSSIVPLKRYNLEDYPSLRTFTLQIYPCEIPRYFAHSVSESLEWISAEFNKSIPKNLKRLIIIIPTLRKHLRAQKKISFPKGWGCYENLEPDGWANLDQAASVLLQEVLFVFPIRIEGSSPSRSASRIQRLKLEVRKHLPKCENRGILYTCSTKEYEDGWTLVTPSD